MVFQHFPIVEEEPLVEDNDEDEDEERTQIFEEHDALSQRFRKTMYYGQLPTSGDRFSLSMTELCVEQFNDMGLEALEAKLNKLDMERAAEITKNTCASPTSLILALLYLDRLRNSNPTYLHSISSTDLFLVSLMVASKFLHDDGEEDEVFNDEWATSASMEKKDLNKLEIEFLVAIDWNVYASNDDFHRMTRQLETVIASRQVASRGWTTYTDLLVLSRNLQMEKLWSLLAECTFKVTAVCASAYAASLMTMLGTCYILSKTSLSPNNVQNSLTTIYTSIRPSSMAPCDGEHVDFETDDSSPLGQGSQLDAVSLIVASLVEANSENKDLNKTLSLEPHDASAHFNSDHLESAGKNWTESVFGAWPMNWLPYGNDAIHIKLKKTHCIRNSFYPSRRNKLCLKDEDTNNNDVGLENSILTHLLTDVSVSAQRHELLSYTKFGIL